MKPEVMSFCMWIIARKSLRIDIQELKCYKINLKFIEKITNYILTFLVFFQIFIYDVNYRNKIVCYGANKNN